MGAYQSLLHALLGMFTSVSLISGLPVTGIPERYLQVPIALKTPKSVLQGDVVVVRASAFDATKIVGTLDAQPLRFSRVGTDGLDYIGLAGVDSLRPPGRYAIIVTATLRTGIVLTASAILNLLDARFQMEAVTLPASLVHTIDPLVSATEEAEVSAVYVDYTEPQRWGGVFRAPIKGNVISHYGHRRTYNGIDLGTFHAGVDFSALEGRPVTAAASGRVAFVKRLTVRGNTVIIDHGRGVYTSYAHMSKSVVKLGQLVSKGEKIGEVGSTGRSQGNHLHFELVVGGVAVEPLFWLRQVIP